VPTSIWRIACATPDYVSDDLTGRGAEITGGRWSRKGTPMVYASCSRALACLETLVHLAGPEPLPLNRFLVEVVVPDGVWSAREIFQPLFHVGWDAEPPGKISMAWGNAWALGKSSLLAEVPSIVVPEEPNLLLNPAHRDIGQLTAIKLRRWTDDVSLG